MNNLTNVSSYSTDLSEFPLDSRHVNYQAQALGLFDLKSFTLGALTEQIAMAPAGTGGSFFYRMPPGLFHTLVFRSEWLVFIETTIGPFERSQTELAEWAPPETDPAAGHAYLAGLAPARSSALQRPA